jgi:hypothetical protein
MPLLELGHVWLQGVHVKSAKGKSASKCTTAVFLTPAEGLLHPASHQHSTTTGTDLLEIYCIFRADFVWRVKQRASSTSID